MISRIFMQVILVGLCISVIACTAKQTLVTTGQTCTTNSDCGSLNCVAGVCKLHGEVKQVDLNLQADVRPKTQAVATNQLIQLFGGGSTVLANKVLTFSWTLSAPTGSNARIDNPSAESPTFVADVAGEYTASLAVSDGSSISESQSTIITAYKPGTNDVHLIAALYPPLKTGNMWLYMTPSGLLQRKVMDLQILDNKNYYRVIPTTYGHSTSNPNELPATEMPMLMHASSQGGRKIRAIEDFEEVAFLLQPELVMVPYALKLGVLTTNWSQTVTIVNQQKIFLQVAIHAKLAAIESCPMQYRSIYPKCYKIEREQQMVFPLHRDDSPARFRITEWIVKGVGVVKIRREAVVEEHNDFPDPLEPHPEVPPLDPPPPPPVDDLKTVSDPPEPISSQTADPTDDVVWRTSGVISELIYSEINGAKDGTLPPLTLMLEELTEDKAPRIDGNRDDWDSITPVALDLQGDLSNADISRPKADIASISFAIDANWLYMLITFYDDGSAPSIYYNMRFHIASDHANSSDSLRIVIESPYEKWACYVRSGSDVTKYPGDVQVGDDFVEVRIPRNDLVQDVFENGAIINFLHETIGISTKQRSNDTLQLSTVIRVPKR